MDTDDVPATIRRVRREADLSQRGLAQALGVGQATIARWETGQTEPTITQYRRLLALAEITVTLTAPVERATRPMTWEAPRDRAGRLHPAHLDLIDDRDAFSGEPWIRAPHRRGRDERRRRTGIRPDDHPALTDLVEQRAARAAANRARLREFMAASPGATAPRTSWVIPHTQPPPWT